MSTYKMMQKVCEEKLMELSDQYEIIEDIGQGYYKVANRKDDIILYNIINSKGRILSDIWFEWIGEFIDGNAIVLDEGKYNIITKQAIRLFTLSREYTLIEYKGNGIYLIRNKKGKYNLIGKDYKVVAKKWFDNITSITKQGAIVITDKKLHNGQIEHNYNYLALNGKFLFIKNSPKIEEYDGYIRAYFKDWEDRWYRGNVLWQRIIRTRDGRVMAEGRFTAIYDIQGGYKVIQREGKQKQFNLLDRNYQLVFDEWFDDVSVFFYGIKNNNIFFAAGNEFVGELRFRIYNKDKQEISDILFDTLYPLNTQSGQYILMKGDEEYKVYIREEIIVKL